MRKIDCIDPRLKLIWCLVLLLTALLSDYYIAELVILALILLTDTVFTRDLRKYKILFAVSLITASQIFFMQILFNREGTLIAEWWIISVYSAALPEALLGTLRTMAVSFAAIQMLTWTSSEDAVLMLITCHVPYRYAMLVTMVNRFLPLLKEEYTTIAESQAIRGVPFDGIVNKIKLLPRVFMPFLYRSLRRTSEIALSMELRGFGKSRTRTFTKKLQPSTAEIFCGVILILVFFVYQFLIHLNSNIGGILL